MPPAVIPSFFHADQLTFKPRYEWAFGEKIDHPETTARAEGILAALEADAARYDLRRPAPLVETVITSLHDQRLITMLKTAKELRRGNTFYPAVFMRGEFIEPNPTNIAHAGSFCFDSGTPLSRETWAAAFWSASSAVAAADLVKSGERPVAYALSRPPGHHATRSLFGGYCYLANAALAAKHLAAEGARVCILDIDVHHGNGSQSLFWNDPQVLTISLHGDPTHFFPFFTGFASETGGPAARDCNVNVPLEEKTDGQAYEAALDRWVFPRMKAFAPDYVVVAAGVDTYERDPMGDFTLTTDDLHRIGERIGALGHPMAVVQEGGYYTKHIGRNVTAILAGLGEGYAHRAGRG
ncbi:MAG: histone deacetylase family protein [Polyangiaceae bacterium]